MLVITVLNHGDISIAKQILDVQLPAYRVEADIIVFYEIPPLRDTAKTIASSEEHFIGYRVGERLAGFISYELPEKDGDVESVDICRMVVHPDFFRRGIAKQLLAHLLDSAAAGKRVTVSTGAKNEPAKSLYRSFGFVEKKEIEIAPDVFLTVFERNLE